MQAGLHLRKVRNFRKPKVRESHSCQCLKARSQRVCRLNHTHVAGLRALTSERETSVIWCPLQTWFSPGSFFQHLGCHKKQHSDEEVSALSGASIQSSLRCQPLCLWDWKAMASLMFLLGVFFCKFA
eukprot:Lithocolla_globosa_v1_NODE_4290_length_1470_cov_9.632509.p4 type:complete len:127 gc:universal NODE_4290_length_1470_cov_9.632509:778-1158(+)